jgi:hypothetical protein
MIEINLLPPEHRPVERTPLPRLLTILCGVLLSAAAVIAWLWLSVVSVPNAKRRCEAAKAEMEKVQQVAKRVQQIESELKADTDRQNVLNDLFNQRISWAKLLDRLAEARASVKSTDDVVLAKVEIRRATSAAVPGKSVESRQLYVQAFVATGRKEAGARELSDTAFEFIRALCRDSAFKQDFECEEAGDKNAKYSYLGDQFVELRPTAAAPKDARGPAEARDSKDELKATLTFDVIFTFKPPLTTAKPAASVAKPPAPVKK